MSSNIMRALKWLFIVFASGVGFVSFSSPAVIPAPHSSAPPLNAAMTALGGQLNLIKTYQAQFKQVTTDLKGQQMSLAEGRVMIMRPGGFRWETDQPTQQVLVTDGKDLWIYDIDLAQATYQPLGERWSLNPALLLSGSVESLARAFTATENKKDDVDLFTLTPRQKDVSFKWIRLIFKNGQLIQLVTLNQLDQTTVFSFEKIQMNRPLDPSLFQFKPPKGVDVVAG